MSTPLEIDHIVSLGGYCQAAYQIERRFGYLAASPFDWLVTPLDAVKKVLDSDGEHFAKKIQTAYDGNTTVCVSYGVGYHHEYERDSANKVIITAESILKSRAKLIYKYNKMIQTIAENRRTLFVRLGGHCDHAIANPYLSDSRPVETQDFNDLCDTISGKFPELEFRVAFVYFDQITKINVDEGTLDDRVQIFLLEDDRSHGWQGSAQGWDQVLDRYSYSFVTN